LNRRKFGLFIKGAYTVAPEARPQIKADSAIELDPAGRENLQRHCPLRSARIETNIFVGPGTIRLIVRVNGGVHDCFRMVFLAAFSIGRLPLSGIFSSAREIHNIGMPIPEQTVRWPNVIRRRFNMYSSRRICPAARSGARIR